MKFNLFKPHDFYNSSNKINKKQKYRCIKIKIKVVLENP